MGPWRTEGILNPTSPWPPFIAGTDCVLTWESLCFVSKTWLDDTQTEVENEIKLKQDRRINNSTLRYDIVIVNIYHNPIDCGWEF